MSSSPNGMKTSKLFVQVGLLTHNSLRAFLFFFPREQNPFRIARTISYQERNGHILTEEKNPGHQRGVPGTPGGTNKDLPAGVPGISCYLL